MCTCRVCTFLLMSYNRCFYCGRSKNNLNILLLALRQELTLSFFPKNLLRIRTHIFVYVNILRTLPAIIKCIPSYVTYVRIYVPSYIRIPGNVFLKLHLRYRMAPKPHVGASAGTSSKVWDKSSGDGSSRGEGWAVPRGESRQWRFERSLALPHLLQLVRHASRASLWALFLRWGKEYLLMKYLA